MPRGLVPNGKGGWKAANWVVKANIEHERLLKAKLICAACGRPLSAENRDSKLDDCCVRCAADFR